MKRWGFGGKAVYTQVSITLSVIISAFLSVTFVLTLSVVACAAYNVIFSVTRSFAFSVVCGVSIK